MTYLGLCDLDTVEGGGAEVTGGAGLGRNSAGREESDGGDDSGHGVCVLYSELELICPELKNSFGAIETSFFGNFKEWLVVCFLCITRRIDAVHMNEIRCCQ